MNWPLVFGVCENEFQRDQEFLRAFANAHQVDLKLTPLEGPVRSDRAARLLSRRLDNASAQGAAVRALLVHADTDAQGFAAARSHTRRWAEENGLTRLPLIVCAPEPCLERWLCRCEGLKGASRPANAPCHGWKKAWEAKRSKVDLDRVRLAASVADRQLRGLADFDAFAAEWSAALATRAYSG